MKKLLTLTLLILGVFTLGACNDDSDTELLINEALDAIIISGADSIKSDITLPTASRNDSTVVWSSSNTAVVAADGTVTRPAVGAGNATVTLTASVTLEGITLTKDFQVRVIELEPSNSFTSVTDLYTNSSENDIVEFEGIVVGMFSGGYFLSDGTNQIGVYAFGSTVEVALGDSVKVKGSYVSYYTLWQIGDVTEVTVVSTGNEYSVTPAVKTVAEINDLDSDNKLIHGAFYTVTGVLTVQGDYGNLFLVDGEDEVLIYYYSNADSLTALADFEGEKVSIDVIYYTNHASNGVMLVFQGGTADVTIVTKTDAEVVAQVAGNIDLGDYTHLTENLTLPTTDESGATIAWATSDAAVITDAGVITVPDTGNTNATLTATVTLNDAVTVVEFNVVVLDPALLVTYSVTDALAEADGTNLLVEGVVSGLNGTWGLFIQDSDGTAIYVDSQFEGVEVGDKVIVRGDLFTRTEYTNSQRMLENSFLFADNNGNWTVFVITDQTVAQIVDAHPASSSKIYTADLTFDYSNYGDAFFDGGSGDAVLFMDGMGDLGYLLSNGDIVTATFIVYDISYGNIRIVDVVLPEFTNQELADGAASYLDVPTTVVSNIELETTLDFFGATVVWSSDTVASIANDGTVVAPGVGEDDVAVVLTATITVGDVVVVQNFNVTVLAPVPAQPLFFSEYGEPDSYNCKYVEIYNPTDAEVNLDGYFVKSPDEGDLFNTDYRVDTLTGMLPAGGVIIVGNADCFTGNDAPSVDAGFPQTGLTYITGTAVGYSNGDDAIGLFYYDQLIDVIGQEGQLAPISSDVSGTSKDTWAVGNGNLDGGYICDSIMRRVPTVVSGETDWAVGAMQWIVVGVRDYTDVGTHTVS